MTDPMRDRMEQAIARLGAEREPPPGWQARVFARLERRRAVRMWFAIAALAAAAACVALALRGPRPGALSMTAELTRGPRIMRGDASEIRAAAQGGAGRLAIWVYRNGRELVATCPGHAGCHGDGRGDALGLELPVERTGTYQVVAVSAAARLPVPAGSYDADLAAVIDAGANWTGRQLDLR
jgi:hypothetical protein